jgi:hypothetical protein
MVLRAVHRSLILVYERDVHVVYVIDMAKMYSGLSSYAGLPPYHEYQTLSHLRHVRNGASV